jgi:hypothetical protein
VKTLSRGWGSRNETSASAGTAKEVDRAPIMPGGGSAVPLAASLGFGFVESISVRIATTPASQPLGGDPAPPKGPREIRPSARCCRPHPGVNFR